MKPRLFVLLFIAALLLVLGTIAAACGDDDDGGSDEDAIRTAFQDFVEAQNNFADDPDRMAEIATESFLAGCCDPEFIVEDPQILSVSVREVGDQKIATVEGTRTENGETIESTITFVKEDDRWLINNVAER